MAGIKHWAVWGCFACNPVLYFFPSMLCTLSPHLYPISHWTHTTPAERARSSCPPGPERDGRQRRWWGRCRRCGSPPGWARCSRCMWDHLERAPPRLGVLRWTGTRREGGGRLGGGGSLHLKQGYKDTHHTCWDTETDSLCVIRMCCCRVVGLHTTAMTPICSYWMKNAFSLRLPCTSGCFVLLSITICHKHCWSNCAFPRSRITLSLVHTGIIFLLTHSVM